VFSFIVCLAQAKDNVDASVLDYDGMTIAVGIYRRIYGRGSVMGVATPPDFLLLCCPLNSSKTINNSFCLKILDPPLVFLVFETSRILSFKIRVFCCFVFVAKNNDIAYHRMDLVPQAKICYSFDAVSYRGNKNKDRFID